ncbi:ChaN family lipoprotein [Amaricoccus solimangrovi]|uniref:ChaN family lipoprotein n=1 Tax=Amaricoccus solimangrovi TaxID=2589815 RepID=A0A501WV80_9RHOB|nr:ChaN family lipoprotein [Amaricoccus solimangrovi]TPE52652.1 ChaN family lipoprotein [Amaricoccus solimangrovi]
MSAGRWRDPASGGVLDEAEAIGRLAAADIALLGERHDSAEDHRWQAGVIAALAARGPLAVGLEMLPRSARPQLDALVAGSLSFAQFVEVSDWARVWGFDPGLYRPIFDVCRARGIPMFGLNVPRALVKRIRAEGWDALPEGERVWLSPAAPASGACRRYLFAMTGGARPGRAARAPEDPAFDSFARAQGVWDRAFACALAEARGRDPTRRLVGVIGRGHLEYGFGVPAQLRHLGAGSAATALPGDGGAVPGEGPIADLVFDRAEPPGG